MTLLGGVLALAAGLAGGGCHAPVLRVALMPAPAKQGAIVVATLRSDAALARADASWAGKRVPMEGDAEQKRFRGLVGVDFESATGRRRLRFEVEDLCGGRYAASRELDVRSGKFRVEKLEVAPAYVEPPASELDRIREDREKVARVWETGDTSRRWTGPFRLPVDAPVREKSFGSRRIFNGEPRSSHSGVDLAAAAGEQVTAPAPGRVALAEELYFSGGTVILDHGAGLFTGYFHLSRLDVSAGEIVAAGSRIGAVGATGRATGPHLHWSARLDDARVNPLGLLNLPSWPLATGRDSLTGQSQ